MKFLIDTHAFIWWDSAPGKLSDRALALCENPENELILSVASLWEIQIKSQIGKITLKTSLPELVDGQQKSNNLRLLSVAAAHVYEVSKLPLIHKDPFDRMIVAQARVGGLCIVSHDTSVKKYPVDVEW